jgi:type II secretory pathway pseudopilin PulG
MRRKNAEEGFTLVEAMAAMLILSFGLIAVANLLFVAMSSNSVANHQTAGIALATDVMERLKAVPFTRLRPGGATVIATTATPAPGIPTTDVQPLNMSPAVADVGVAGCAEPGRDCVSGADILQAGGCASGIATCYNNYNLIRNVPGVGTIKVRWRIVDMHTGTNKYFIRVAAESLASTGATGLVRAPLVGGRAHVEVSTFRVCADSTCP